MSPWFKKWLCIIILWYSAFFIITEIWGTDNINFFIIAFLGFFIVIVLRFVIRVLRELFHLKLEIYFHY